jgi:hypothetical protein
MEHVWKCINTSNNDKSMKHVRNMHESNMNIITNVHKEQTHHKTTGMLSNPGPYLITQNSTTSRMASHGPLHAKQQYTHTHTPSK